MAIKTLTINKNWEIGTNSRILKNIRQKDINIAIYEREIESLTKEIDRILNQDIEFRSSGDIDTIIDSVKKTLNPKEFSLIIQDIHELLQLFKEISDAKSLKLLFATVNTNMCRRFHTDINDLRMLCTYSGPGTLWLTEDNINRNGLDCCGDTECIVINENEIKQAQTGSVVILKGAIFPTEGTKAVVHRSPTIEESGEKRLLLRIDTNEFLNF
jgi:hypothetical protein